MTKARDTANIVGGGFSGTIAGATMEPTGDTAAGDNAAIGFTSAEGLIITGQGSTGDVTIKNDADALVAHVPTGTTGVNFAGDVIVPDGDLILGSTAVTATGAEINLIDGGTARGTTAVADGDGFLTNDGGTMRMTKVDTLATYMGTKIGGGLEFISSLDLSNAATASFTGFDSSKYDSYMFRFANVLPVTDDADVYALLSVDSGSNYLAASDSYTIEANQHASAGDSAFIPFGYSGLSNVDGGGMTATVDVIGPHLNKRTFVYPSSGMVNIPDESVSANYFNAVSYGGGGQTKANTVVNAIQFKFSSGNIASGTITMYGMVNS